MALKPSKKHIPVFTEEEVIQMRKWFYEEQMSYKDIHLEMYLRGKDISASTLKSAIKGRGAFYSKIKDDIPQQYKDERMEIDKLRKATERYCIQVSRGAPHKQALINSGLPERFTRMPSKEEWEAKQLREAKLKSERKRVF